MPEDAEEIEVLAGKVARNTLKGARTRGDPATDPGPVPGALGCNDPDRGGER